MTWQTAKATMIRNHLSNKRGYPWSFTFGHIINGLYMVLLSFFVYHYWIDGRLESSFTRYTGTTDYITYAVIGGLLSNLSVSMIMNVSRALITEYREGTLEVLLLAPAGRTGYHLGTAFQQLSRVALEAAPVLIVGVLTGASLPDARWSSALPAFLLYLAACFSMGLALGAVMLYTRDTYLVQNTLFALTALVCGFQFPVEYLPEPLRYIGDFFPLTGTLDILRDSLLNGVPISAHRNELLLSVVLIVLFALVGSRCTGIVERRFFDKSH